MSLRCDSHFATSYAPFVLLILRMMRMFSLVMLFDSRSRRDEERDAAGRGGAIPSGWRGTEEEEESVSDDDDDDDDAERREKESECVPCDSECPRDVASGANFPCESFSSDRVPS